MTQERHLFTYETSNTYAHSLRKWLEEGKALFELTCQIEEWINQNDVRDYVQHEPVCHQITERTAAWEMPSWDFGNELDAVMFKLLFGEHFDYTVYDA